MSQCSAPRCVLLVASLGLLACGAAAPTPSQPAQSVVQTSATRASTTQSAASVSSDVPGSRGGQELIGTPALALSADLEWLSGDAMTLENLRGKVVLVRFWTDTCPFCEASAPGLTRLHERYADQGLVVLGLFHPKPRGSVRDMKAVGARAKELGMGFAIANDVHWETLERWWLASGPGSGEGERAATSVSFLIDAQGVIRWIHPGPEFHPGGPADHEQCRADYDDAVRAIEVLLREAQSQGVQPRQPAQPDEATSVPAVKVG